jgi:hypothetical protein
MKDAAGTDAVGKVPGWHNRKVVTPFTEIPENSRFTSVDERIQALGGQRADALAEVGPQPPSSAPLRRFKKIAFSTLLR